ncbi:hypothetical protein [Psittacicella hinzii]|uniref:Uncharacterized protein n=1 Tax=Psittacicella hinzii TaxID=2028575 RepID=A0A3A1YQY3_9GAMM|nr:hypothetical protein [Psittacicella hinzii]RIY38814.1 hypothetical protein CKF58_03285 [Psittacicella hinzii]
MNLFERTNPRARHLFMLLVIGIIAGLMSAALKSGWEDVLPPRLPGAVPPPVEFLGLFGISTEHMTYT